MKRTGIALVVLTLALLLGAATSRPAAADTLSLQGGRFQVGVTWKTTDGATGPGTPVTLTGDSGYFWFFNAANVELIVKVLDGCSLNQRFWVFAGGLTNVNTTLTVTDTHTGAVKIYTNPPSTPFKPIQDTSAFNCP
jgi:hypothetical protein